MRTTHSERTRSAALEKAGESGSATHLGEAVMVAQVDEQEAAMVAHAMDPAGKADGGADVGLAQLATVMASIGMHGSSRE